VTRSLSHTELRALTRCEAEWDFGYGDALAGSSLRPKVTAPHLREGRMWGRAVAAWHQVGEATEEALIVARAALQAAFEEDAQEQHEAGTFDPDGAAGMNDRLHSILDHYAATVAPLPLTDPEGEFDVEAGTGFRLYGRVDGLHRDGGGLWIVEFKLRGTLTSFEQLALDRQGRRYSWAWERQTGERVAGVIYDERLNEEPRPPKVLKSGKPSTDKRQFTTPELYRAACEAAEIEADEEVAAAFGARRWQQRERIIFRPDELAEVEREIEALAERVTHLEDGRYPIRAAVRQVCGGCSFREVCPNPQDTELVDALFQRVPAKRNREEAPVAA
jgi:hypothetical protein